MKDSRIKSVEATSANAPVSHIATLEKTMDDIDDISYIGYCGPQNLSRSLHTLQGILHGIRLDNAIDDREINELRFWCKDHASYRKINPFNEILTILEESLEDGILDADELKDISWFLDRALGDGTFYSGFTVDLQNLQGTLHGILADRVVTQDEVVALSDWIEDHEHLASCYPYDEIYAILLDVLKDGKVDEEEAEFLKAFFSEFVTLSTNNQINITRELKKKVTTLGVCAVDPEIAFDGKVFCFTGTSIKANRNAMAAMVEELGGIFKRKPTKDISYLVYGAAGNQCWAYSCYGRKVEQIMSMRKSGSSAIIVHENDFWDAYEYNKCS